LSRTAPFGPTATLCESPVGVVQPRKFFQNPPDNIDWAEYADDNKNMGGPRHLGSHTLPAIGKVTLTRPIRITNFETTESFRKRKTPPLQLASAGSAFVVRVFSW
jgi:hypothetical protein